MPAITPEEYKELVVARQEIIEMKAQKSEIYDFIANGEQQLAAARAQLAEADGKIAKKNEELTNRMKEIIGPFEIEGDFSISDTEPHYITPITPQNAQA